MHAYTTSWFTTGSAVTHRDSLSPTMFAIYINDLAKERKQLNIGIPFDNDKICILFYADDIVILTEDAAQLQLLLNFTNTWCKKWK